LKAAAKGKSVQAVGYMQKPCAEAVTVETREHSTSSSQQSPRARRRPTARFDASFSSAAEVYGHGDWANSSTVNEWVDDRKTAECHADADAERMDKERDGETHGMVVSEQRHPWTAAQRGRSKF
jgi:hypothetical protein